MIEIEKPTITKFVDEDGTYGKFVVEPLERGYGTTLGNCMRRILLSSLPGAAVNICKNRRNTSRVFNDTRCQRRRNRNHLKLKETCCKTEWREHQESDYQRCRTKRGHCC